MTRIVLVAALVTLGAASRGRAQELEPRAYSPSPVGTNFFAVIGGATRGEILFDPSIPITDTRSNLGSASLGYGRTFRLGSRQGLVAIAIPYAWGHTEGKVGEEGGRIWRSGLADVRLKASVNLLGPKAMTPEEFRSAPHRTILGVSLTVQAPTGEYDADKLINLGTNRFAIKPEAGISIPAGRWYFDAYAGLWFFETNDRFYPGNATRRQDPLTALQAHASYSFESRVWLAFDATWYGGGESTVDAGPPSARQEGTRIGGTVSVPIAKAQSLKISASTGVSVRTGTDFDTVLVAWQIRWFDRTNRGKKGGTGVAAGS